MFTIRVYKQGKLVELLDCLAEEFNQDTILFIGSGASVPAGLPSWCTLVTWLRDYTSEIGGDVLAANAFLDDGDLVKAASALTLVLEKLGKSLSDFFNEDEKCSVFRDAEPQKVHYLISKLPTTSVITPNYDLLLEKAYQLEGRSIQVVYKGEVDALNNIKRGRLSNYIYKYHGCVTKPDRIVLDYKSYSSEIHGLSVDAECLKNLIQAKTFVFIGAGLEDPDFNHIRDYIIEINQPGSVEFWAFMRGCDAKVDFYRENFGINLISYAGEGSDHSDLLNKLEQLLDKISAADDSKRRAVDLANPEVEGTHGKPGVLRQILIRANEDVIPLDEQILGFVGFFDSVNKSDCFAYLSEYKNNDPSEVANRIEYLVARNLLKETASFLLAVREAYSIEAAENIEDDIMNYLAVKDNG